MAFSIGERVQLKPRETTNSTWHGKRGTVTKIYDDDLGRPFEVRLDEPGLGQVHHFQFDAGDLVSTAPSSS